MNQAVEVLRPQYAPLQVKIADRVEEIEQAQRLRYQVFVEETGNNLLQNDFRFERDKYDEYCDHLIVKDLNSNKVVGTYRLLPGNRAVQNIGFYSETEFYLGDFPEDKKSALELGRSCIDIEYRGGKAIQMLWEGIASYMSEQHFKYLIGCASIHIDSRDSLNQIYTFLKHKGVLTDRFKVVPQKTHRIEGIGEVRLNGTEKEVFRRLPPLMKGYQWLGAEIAGEPAYDKIFDTTDFFIVLQTTRLAKRYQRHFLEKRRQEV
ncbi:GNAT family N-acetyltransferase [Desulforamulus aquiferis]|uniref:GNAT family N-acetyltransferase n=1 Tax=Desulforamulus aquiferis TaxID=1397668 RepID=A0AAW7ZD81_9FIRM|nr:GNAT family N-acyltransferase [Desulforamulus aquiferis]MDO7787011.1 GNAT family N-acetyltransferase [Desulforamulus aquiferis]